MHEKHISQGWDSMEIKDNVLKIWEYISNNPLISSVIAGLIGGIVARHMSGPGAKIRKALKLVDKGDTRRAKKLLSQILEDHPDNKTVSSNALTARARIYISDDDFKSAIQYAKDAIERNKFIGDAYCILGRAYSLNGEHKEAIQNFDIALRRDTKKEADCYLYRGIDYYVQKDYDNSIKDFNKALEIKPKSVLGLVYRGAAYDGNKKYDLAIADYNQAIRLDPKDATAYNNRGVAYRYNGDHDLAIADYDHAIRLDPNFAVAYYNRGTTYGRDKGEYALAVADFTQAIRLDPKDATAYNNRGDAYLNKGDYELAIADCEQAIALDPNYATAYYTRGEAYSDKGDYELAIADFSQAIRLDPNDATAYYNRGVAYQKIGDTARAEADFAKARELGYAKK